MTVDLYEGNGGQLIAVCNGRAICELEQVDSAFSEDAPYIAAEDYGNFTVEIVDAEAVSSLINHAETRLICTYDGAAYTLHDEPGRAGQCYLSDILDHQARGRVRHDAQLAKFESYILADWDEGAAHWYWVATAPKAEILSWIRAGLGEASTPVRDQRLILRLTTEEKQQITDNARTEGVTVSEYIRKRVMTG